MSASRLLRPPRLKPDSKVALIAPAFYFDAALFDQGRAYLESTYNVQSVAKGDVMSRQAYFAGSDERRLDELFDWLVAPEVDALLGIRGGYGIARIFPELMARLKKQKGLKPKIVAGYSDMTILLNGLHQELGWSVFHSPMLTGRPFREPLPIESATFRKCLFTAEPLGPVSDSNTRSLHAGRARGKLVGGCLTLVACAIGTSYDIETDGCILFLEDVDERPYRIDRMLIQLMHAGKLDNVAGIVFGQMHKCDPPAKAEPPSSTTSALDAIRLAIGQFIEERQIPVIYDFPAGHGSPQATFPLGVEVELIADEKQPHVAFLESGTK